MRVTRRDARPRCSRRSALIAVTALASCVSGCRRHDTGDANDERSGAATKQGERVAEAGLEARRATPRAKRGSASTVLLGAVATPEMAQVSIEDDLLLASEVFAAPMRVLFAKGPGFVGVQVLDAQPRGSAIVAALAELFAPRGGRDAHYRAAQLPIDAAAQKEALAQELAAASASARGGALLLYIAGHGEPGETPAESRVSLFGEEGLDVRGLVALLDQTPVGTRQRIIATTCFSGGFAELVFVDADSKKGASPRDRCGLFASPWNQEAAGCDPDPDRRAHEGFGVYFLNALAGRARDGTALPRDTVDFDGDGKISLLEAHAYARIASPAPDVPTTSSERWLRHAVGDKKIGASRSRSVSWPEEQAVLTALEARLGPAAAAKDSLAELEDTVDQLADEADQAAQAEDRAARRAAADLLARWPVLDDPWHPDFGATVLRDRGAIEQTLAHSKSYAAFRAARQALSEADDRLWEQRRAAAPLMRLVRTHENLALAGALAARGGEGWRVFTRLLACERSLP